MLRPFLIFGVRPMHWGQSLVQTIAAFFLCLVIVLVCALPAELSRRNDRAKGSMSFGVMIPNSKLFFAAIQQLPNDSAANSVSLECISLDNIVSYMPRASISLDVRCATADAKGRRLFFGRSDSSLYFTDTSEPFNRTLLLGHTLKGYPERMKCTLNDKTLVVQDAYGLYGWNIDESGIAPGNPSWCELCSNVDTFELRSDSASGVLSRFDGTQSHIVEFDVQTGKEKCVIARCENRVRALALSADDQILVGIDDSARLIQICQRNQAQKVNCFGDVNLQISSELSPAFSPNGKWLVTSDANVRDLFVWNTESQSMTCIFAHPRGTKLLGFGFLSDNELISWGTEKIVRVWKQSESNPIQSLKL